MTGEDVLEPVQRQVIAVLARDRLGQEPRTGQPLIDRLRWLVRDRHMLLTGPTGVAEPHVLEDPHRGRDVLQLLADFLADLHTQVAAVRTGQLPGGQFVFDPFPGQVLGQSLPPTTAPAAACGRGVLWLGRFLWRTLCQALGLLVGEQPELVGIDAFPPGTILAPE